MNGVLDRQRRQDQVPESGKVIEHFPMWVRDIHEMCDESRHQEPIEETKSNRGIKDQGPRTKNPEPIEETRSNQGIEE